MQGLDTCDAGGVSSARVKTTTGPGATLSPWDVKESPLFHRVPGVLKTAVAHESPFSGWHHCWCFQGNHKGVFEVRMKGRAGVSCSTVARTEPEDARLAPWHRCAETKGASGELQSGCTLLNMPGDAS